MTAQFPDQIILDGQTRPLLTLPPIPFDHPRIVPLAPDEARSRFPEAFSTACHRHYVATWEVREERLYLVDLRGLWELQGNEPLMANWFTGTLGVGLGDVVRYTHFGFESQYEGELWMAVEQGRVVARREEWRDEGTP